MVAVFEGPGSWWAKAWLFSEACLGGDTSLRRCCTDGDLFQHQVLSTDLCAARGFYLFCTLTMHEKVIRILLVGECYLNIHLWTAGHPVLPVGDLLPTSWRPRGCGSLCRRTNAVLDDVILASSLQSSLTSVCLLLSAVLSLIRGRHRRGTAPGSYLPVLRLLKHQRGAQVVAVDQSFMLYPRQCVPLL